MLGWIKYLPYKFRHSEEPCTPGGPTIRSARDQVINIGGSVLTISMPPHRYPYGGEYKRVDRRDQLNFLFRRYNNRVMANDDWRHRLCIARTWEFSGPWFTGSKARIHGSVVIISRAEEKEYQNVSFFNPVVFENVLIDYLNDSYGHKRREQWPDYIGPLDWALRTDFPVSAASFYVQNMYRDQEMSTRETILVFPITHKHFVEINLSLKGIVLDNEEDCRLINPKPLLDLQNFILRSVSLELSPETKKEVEAIKVQFPEAALPECFAPLKWPTAISGDVEEGGVLLGKGLNT